MTAFQSGVLTQFQLRLLYVIKRLLVTWSSAISWLKNYAAHEWQERCDVTMISAIVRYS